MNEIKSKEQKRIDSNQKIINSAIKEFASKGYTNAKLTSIAKEASVTAGLIGQRYGTKDNLVLTIIKDNLLMTDEDISSSNNDLFLILEKLTKKIVKFYYENNDIFNFYFSLFTGKDLSDELTYSIRDNFYSTNIPDLILKLQNENIIIESNPFDFLKEYLYYVFSSIKIFTKRNKPIPNIEWFLNYVRTGEQFVEGKTNVDNSIDYSEYLKYLNLKEIVILDLNNGDTTVLYENANDPINKLKNYNFKKFEERIYYDVNFYVIKQDKEKYLYHFSKETILEKFKTCNSYFFHFRALAKDEIHDYEVSINKYIDSFGVMNAIYYISCIDDKNEQYLSRNKRNTNVLAFTSDFELVDYVNLYTFDITNYRKPKLKQLLSFENKDNVKIDDFLIYFKDNFVAPDDKAHFASRTNINLILSRINDEVVYSVSFKMKIGSLVKYYQFKFVKIEGENAMMVGLKDIDNEVRDDIFYLLKEQEQRKQPIFNILDKYYEAIYSINLNTGSYEVFVSNGDYNTFIIDKLTNGDNFFDDLQIDSTKFIYFDDIERIIKDLNKKYLSINLQLANDLSYKYRLLVNDEPIWYTYDVFCNNIKVNPYILICIKKN